MFPNTGHIPRQWTDFKMQCSCPDWAVPCKHLAAVVYMICREIDNNPFLVFEMHNVNLLEALKKRGIIIEDIKKTEIPALSGLLTVNKKKLPLYDETKAYERVDFSKLNSIADSLVMLLPDEPPFYQQGNFRDKFQVLFTRCARNAKRLLAKKLSIEALYEPDEFVKGINHHTTLSLFIDTNNRVEITGENHPFSSFNSLIPALYALNPDRLPDYQPSVAAYTKILLASLHLIANGNVVPQIVKLENQNYLIRWVPALIEVQVRKLIDRLVSILPPNLLLVQKISGKKQIPYPLSNQIPELLSILISELMTRLSKPVSDDLFDNMFFKQKEYAFTGVGEHALSGGIKVWLDRFFLTNGDYRPVITVTELGDDTFDVAISIERTDAPDELPVELVKILHQKQYEKHKFKILQSLSLLTPFIKGLDTYINTETQEPIRFDIQSFSPFLVTILPAIRLLDVKVLLPKSLQHLLKPQLSINLKRNQETQGYVRLDELLSFNWQVALEDTLISAEEFKKMLRNASGLFRFKERYTSVSTHRNYRKQKRNQKNN